MGVLRPVACFRVPVPCTDASRTTTQATQATQAEAEAGTTRSREAEDVNRDIALHLPRLSRVQIDGIHKIVIIRCQRQTEKHEHLFVVHIV